MWGLSESQETVGISPEMFGEFVFPYQLPLISRFGLSCYGCCEPLEKRWQYVSQIPNLRRVSVSPWSDQETMSRQLQDNYIFSRKPHPALVSMSNWDEDEITSDLMKTLDIRKGRNVELILKDVHTLSNEPWRLGRWVELAREAIEKE
jgi:hypothetical protein